MEHIKLAGYRLGLVTKMPIEEKQELMELLNKKDYSILVVKLLNLCIKHALTLPTEISDYTSVDFHRDMLIFISALNNGSLGIKNR